MKNFTIFSIYFRRLLLKVFIVSLSVIFLFRLVKLQNNTMKKETEIKGLTEKLEEKVKENEVLEKQIEKGVSDKATEEYAREKLNMIKKGERVFYDVGIE